LFYHAPQWHTLLKLNYNQTLKNISLDFIYAGSVKPIIWIFAWHVELSLVSAANNMVCGSVGLASGAGTT
jgi:hypothetical protein